MSDSQDRELIRLSALQRLRKLFNSGLSGVLAPLVFAFIAYFSMYLLLPKPEPTVEISVAKYTQALESLSDSQILFSQALQSVTASDPKAAITLAEALSKVTFAKTILANGATQSKTSSSFSLLNQAFAEDKPAGPSAGTAMDKNYATGDEFNRPLILYCILAAMGMLVVAFFGIYMFTKDPDRMKFAQTNLQTIISFMIGVAAGMLGTKGT